MVPPINNQAQHAHRRKASLAAGAGKFYRRDANTSGGTWRTPIPTMAETPIKAFENDADLEARLVEAMEEDSDNEVGTMATMEGHTNANSAQHQARLQVEDSLARIAQAMSVLSLAPARNGPAEYQYTSDHSANSGEDSDAFWPPHPTPESLLRESLRQTFEAYRLLKELDHKFVSGGAEARQRQSSFPEGSSRRHSVSAGSPSDQMSIVDVLKLYDHAVDGVKAAQENLNWAEHWIKEEAAKTRDRLLKH